MLVAKVLAVCELKVVGDVDGTVAVDVDAVAIAVGARDEEEPGAVTDVEGVADDLDVPVRVDAKLRARR